MLLNSDIQKKIVQITLHIKKEINVITYIIYLFLNLNFNNFIWIKSQ
jgi:hypothetical protein